MGGEERWRTYLRRPHWSVRYLVVRLFTRKATVPYTAARARTPWGSMPRDLYKIAGMRQRMDVWMERRWLTLVILRVLT